jgi:phosphoenolpyruvate-protein phosphotransferase
MGAKTIEAETRPGGSSAGAASRTVRGLGVSPGVVVGRAVHAPVPLPEPAAAPPKGDAAAESARLRAALDAVGADLEALAASAGGLVGEILQATAMFARDPSFGNEAERLVRERVLCAERAVWEAATGFRELLVAGGGCFAERVSDLDDVRDRVVSRLLGRTAPEPLSALSEDCVLIARDLAPADTVGLDPARVRALVTEQGGPTSHTAILARAQGLPAVVACSAALSIPAGATVMVDGATGIVVVDPDSDQVSAAEQRTVVAPRRLGRCSGRTLDGTAVALLANVGHPADAAAAAAAGAQGVGLFRTEFLFLDQAEMPLLAQQIEAYSQVFAAFAGCKVVIRTLDAGADKPLPFLRQADEPNPALGVRGYRTTVDRPEVLETQLAAIAAAAAAASAEVWVMAPMISTAAEAADFAAMARAVGLSTVGAMVEVPAAALAAEELLAEVDFISIGTNDLAQYTFAADRMLGSLATLNDPWHPALLRLVALAADAGRRAGRPAGLCGEAAADPALAAVLVGLGVRSLSMTPRALGAVDALLSSRSLADCESLARAATASPDAAVARARVTKLLAEAVVDES